MSVDMDKVGVVQCLHTQWTTCIHMNYGSQYAAITPNLSMSTDTIEWFLQFLAKHCTRLSDDGSSVIRNMSEQFKIFYYFIVSTYYILCIGWIIKCLNPIEFFKWKCCHTKVNSWNFSTDQDFVITAWFTMHSGCLCKLLRSFLYTI